MSKYNIKAIDLPKFSYRERDYIDEYRISFAQARGLNELGVLGLQRIHKFLKEAYANIDQTEVWSKPVKSTRSASKSSKLSTLAAATAETSATDAQAVVSGK
ncbi:hypothetical protein [Chroococcidiopsis sp.]|uniref:hypothetical protein n=1 Tax=Chroococcidiopsis sp. TaxID=3088168 RepID=UPI003F3D4676